MPGTASNRNTDRARSRTRPSSVARGAKTNTPILFRLPIVQFPEVAEELQPAFAEASPAVPPPILATPVFEPQPSVPPEPAVEAAVEPTRMEAPAGDLPRSWWEHWSSGVVLILLVIALVTASIIAFNDTPPAQADSLAASSAIEEFDLDSMQIPSIDTGHVVAPAAAGGLTPNREPQKTISSGKTELAEKPNAAPQAADPVSPAPVDLVENSASGTQNSAEKVPPTNGLEFANDLLEMTSGSGAVASSASTSSAPTKPAEAKQTATSESLILGELEFSELTQQAAPAAGSLKVDAVVGNSSSAPVAKLEQAPLAMETPTPASSPGLTSAALQPLATLSSPIGVPSPNLPSKSVTNSASGSKPTAPAMTASVAEEPSISQPAGASPQFYDGAAATAPIEATAAVAKAPQTAPQASGVRNTNLPELSGLLIASPSGANYSSASHQRTSSTVDTAQPVDTPPAGLTAAAGNSPGIVQSQTPELDTDAIAQAYMRFQQLNKAQNQELSNRYQAAQGLAQPTAGTPTQPAATSNSGFTLGVPRQTNPALPPTGSR